MSQEPLWYYLEGQDVRGPVAAGQLRQMARARQISPTTQICKAGTEDWVEASRLRLDFGPPGGGHMPASTAPAGPIGGPFQPDPEPGGEHSLFSPGWILDYQFKKSVTPQIVKTIWLLYIVFGILGVLGLTLMLFMQIINTKPIQWFIPMGLYLVQLLGVLFGALIFRAWLEFLINFFFMARNMEKIARRDD